MVSFILLSNLSNFSDFMCPTPYSILIPILESSYLFLSSFHHLILHPHSNHSFHFNSNLFLLLLFSTLLMSSSFTLLIIIKFVLWYLSFYWLDYFTVDHIRKKFVSVYCHLKLELINSSQVSFTSFAINLPLSFTLPFPQKPTLTTITINHLLKKY